VIPGKKYRPEDYLQIAWRRRWLIAVPAVVISAITVTVVSVLPNKYRSDALLLIVPPRVQESYVKQTIKAPMDERVQALKEEILSRSRLEGVIKEFDLYPKERATMLMDDVIERMRTRDIHVSPPRSRRPDGDSGSFTVSFDYTDPHTAMLVTQKLASLFVLENIENRTGVVEQTDQFLQTQLDDTRRQLVDYEKRLKDFREARPGLMPAQVESNQQGLAATQQQLQAIQESINRDRDRQLILQRRLTTLSQSTPLSPDGQPLQGPPSTLEAAKAALRQMRLRLTSDHPDVKKLERTIRQLEQQAAAEALQQPVSAAPVSGDPARAAEMSDLKAENDLIDRRLTQKQTQEKLLQANAETYRRRLEAAPGVESEVAQLMRDYTTLQTVYTSLLARRQEAKVSANVERGQIGEQFKIIDPPRAAAVPFSPTRLRLDLMGIAGALGAGLLLAGLLEYRDTSLRTEDDIMVALSLPVVALVPTIGTAASRTKRKRWVLLAASSGLTAAVLIVLVIVWKLKS
jgi:polysaccharide chain length determinant protein (PEP-CTERM system associated)